MTGTITSGMHMGDLVADKVLSYVEERFQLQKINEDQSSAPYVASSRAWMKACVSTCTRGLGVIAAFYLKRLTQTFSACVMGAQLLVDSTDILLSPLFAKYQDGKKIKYAPEVLPFVRAGLVAVGLWSQIRIGAKMPFFTRFMLSPVLAFESVLTALATH